MYPPPGKSESRLGQSMRICRVLLFLVAPILCQTAAGKEPANNVIARPVGLEVGQQAPKFALPDQFGQQQSNDTLKGPNGTVILFFRSADW